MKGHVIGAILLALTLAMTASGQAADLALWTFEASVPVNAGPHTPESGAYAFAGISAANGVHADPNTAYNNPTGNGSVESFSSTNWGVGDYYEFKTRTLGYMGVTVSWDQTSSNTGPRYFVLQYSTDGSTFTQLGSQYSVLANAAPNAPWS
jgi:hypothetical protein